MAIESVCAVADEAHMAAMTVRIVVFIIVALFGLRHKEGLFLLAGRKLKV